MSEQTEQNSITEVLGVVESATFGWDPDYNAVVLKMGIKTLRGYFCGVADAEGAMEALATWKTDVGHLRGRACVVHERRTSCGVVYIFAGALP